MVLISADHKFRHCQQALFFLFLFYSVIPLSLLALHCCIQNLSLRRVAVNMDSKETSFSISSSLCGKETCIPNEGKPQAAASSLVETEAIKKPSYKNGQCMDMTHIFRRHVKPKKQHEIDKLGQVRACVCLFILV